MTAVIPDTRTPLRLVVAGSVDDGKSTLVGRLLHDTKSILADQYDAIERASRARGGDAVDLALLTDGLRAEREQGITIDVAYRYFSTPARSFVLADTPGHTQYTRNMVTGASVADAAVVLVDARNGVVAQTRRHATLLGLLRVPHVLVAVNKMDAVGWSAAVFERVAVDVRAVAAAVGIPDVRVLPVSALTGGNIVVPAAETPWYDGEPLLAQLETLDVVAEQEDAPLRFPVQLVIRPRTPEHPDYRGLAARVASGRVAVGDEVVAVPSGARSTVAAIDTPVGPVEHAGVGESVTVRLADELDVGRGEVLAPADAAPAVVSALTGTLCWLSESPGRPGQKVLVKVGTAVVRAILTSIDAAFDVETLGWGPADGVALNDIVTASVRLAAPVALDGYAGSRETGAFLVVDPASGATLAAGLADAP